MQKEDFSCALYTFLTWEVGSTGAAEFFFFLPVKWWGSKSGERPLLRTRKVVWGLCESVLA